MYIYEGWVIPRKGFPRVVRVVFVSRGAERGETRKKVDEERYPVAPLASALQRVASLSHRMNSLNSFRKPTPPQNRQLVVYY